MSLPTYLLSSLTCLGLLLSLGLSIVIFRRKKPNAFANKLLAGLLIAVNLRVMKPIFLLYAELPLWLEQIGLVAMLLAPVLLFLYLKVVLENKKRLIAFDSLHLSAALLYLFFSLPDFRFDAHLYQFVLAQNLVYWGACLYLVAAHDQAHQKAVYRWVVSLMAGVGVILGSYLFAYVYDGSIFFMCTTSTLSYSLLVAGLAGLVMGKKLIFAEPVPLKYKNSTMEDDQKTAFFAEIKASVERHDLYLNPELTLNFLSQQTGISARDISQVVNEKTGTNFSDWINGYRVNEAKQKLVSPNYEKAKIVTIAFDSGFNTLSSFNAVFKLKTGFTPTEYRNFHRVKKSKLSMLVDEHIMKVKIRHAHLIVDYRDGK